MTLTTNKPSAFPPLTEKQLRQLNQLLGDMSSSTVLWLSGYLAGRAQQGELRTIASGTEPAPATEAHQKPQVTVLYGSQTGNAKRVAGELASGLETTGVSVRLCGADAYPRRELKRESYLFIVISTQGDGDPPDHARDFLEYLDGSRAPRLETLHYAVLALGDSSYPKFCLVGHNLDGRLEALGAQRLLPLCEADVDIESASAPWKSQVLEQVVLSANLPTPSNVVAFPKIDLAEKQAAITRANPYRAEMLLNQRITGRDSDRDVRHVELLLNGSGIQYSPGDALGVWPTQADALVDEVLGLLKLDGNQVVEYRQQSMPLRNWLKEKRELTVLTRPFLTAHAQRSAATDLPEALTPQQGGRLAQMMETWQLPDLLSRYPAVWSPQDLIAALRPLTPRMYSIASSPLLTDGEEVHLTVAHVDYRYEGAHRWGVASDDLAHRKAGAGIDIFIEANERFRLPPDPNRNIIMIGPGAGVAPFRAFVQERAATGARGRNWLFFGNRHFRSEFLYQTEWQASLANGTLHRLDVAFSRDSAKRVYVQHRIEEKAAELYSWLDEGAYLYVCGDASHMAPDVHDTLRRIGIQQGSLSEEDAGAWLDRLIRDGRYVRDIY
jgi:sulfite reductase (NADPH) flavoprotein alpha-component